MSKQLFILAHDMARERAIHAVRNAPTGHAVTISEPTRTLDQNAALHAVLQEISEQREWAGKKWDVDTWKRLLTAAWVRAEGGTVTMVPAIDGAGFDVIYQRTSDLTKQECSSLIEYVTAWHMTSD